MPDIGPSIDDFISFLPTKAFYFIPTGTWWSAAGVNACLKPVPVLNKDGTPVLIPMKVKDEIGKTVTVMAPKTIAATAWLDRKRQAHHMTWAPGASAPVVANHLIIDGEWVARNKIHTLNHYRPPVVSPGNPTKAGPWLKLVKKIFPDECEHIVAFFAHRVQRPGDKINHALLLIGAPGIGKDTVLEPLRYAVGPHNFREVSPTQLLACFNSYLKAVVIRVSEIRDLGDFTRYAFYEHMKVLLASPPSMLRVDEKFIAEYQVVNCCGVVLTSNHLTDGLYLPADDRRHFVAKSELTKEAFEPEYWAELWGWYADGGLQHVASYLAALDISKFDEKAPPPKTPAFYAIADSNRSPEEAELEDAIDGLGRPAALTLTQIIDTVSPHSSFGEWLSERKNRRAIPHRLETVGYAVARSPDAESGLWRINGVRQVIYANASLSVREQQAAARALQAEIEAAVKQTKEFFAATKPRPREAARIMPKPQIKTPPPAGKTDKSRRGKGRRQRRHNGSADSGDTGFSTYSQTTLKRRNRKKHRKIRARRRVSRKTSVTTVSTAAAAGPKRRNR
jgi:hypothetical protein